MARKKAQTYHVSQIDDWQGPPMPEEPNFRSQNDPVADRRRILGDTSLVGLAQGVDKAIEQTPGYRIAATGLRAMNAGGAGLGAYGDAMIEAPSDPQRGVGYAVGKGVRAMLAAPTTPLDEQASVSNTWRKGGIELGPLAGMGVDIVTDPFNIVQPEKLLGALPMAMMGGLKVVKGAENAAKGAKAAKKLFGVPEFRPILEAVFPKLDSYGKPRAFLKPQQVVEKLRASETATPEIIATAEEWASTRGNMPAKPAEVVDALSGQAHDRGRVLRRVSEGGDKKLAGAPLGVANRRQEKAIVDRYVQMVEDGVKGADWYNDSGQSILFHAGDDPATADKFGGALAVTSASTGVPVNTGFGVKGHNQAVAGMPINTGRFPSNMREPIEKIYGEAAEDLGKKRDPFAQQLAIGGGYSGKNSARAVHDIWQGEAFGYVNPDGTPLRRGFTDLEHQWMDDRTAEIIAELNRRKVGGRADWNEGSTQAAAWTAAKIKAGQIDPADAATSYADYMKRYYMQSGRDAVPGATTGHLKGLADAPMEVRREYAKRVGDIYYDAKGREIPAIQKGMLAGGSIEGPGVWVDETGLHMHPGRQVNQVVAPTVDKASGVRVLDPASEALAKANEAEYGILMGQDAIAGSMLDYGAKAAQRNAFDLPLPAGVLSDNDPILKDPGVLDLLRKQVIAVMPTEGGVRVINTGMDSEPFKDLMRGIEKAAGTKAEPGRNMGFYEGNPWDKPEGRVGQQFAKLIDVKEIPKLVENFNKSAPDIAKQLNALDREFSQTHGFPLSDALVELRETIAANGFDGIRAMATKYGLPLAAVVLMARTLGWEPEA